MFGGNIPPCMCGGQRTIWRSGFSPSTQWVQAVKLQAFLESNIKQFPQWSLSPSPWLLLMRHLVTTNAFFFHRLGF